MIINYENTFHDLVDPSSTDRWDESEATNFPSSLLLMSRIPIRDVVNSLRRFLHRQNCLPDIHPTMSPFAQHVLRCDLVEVSTSAKWYEAKGGQAGKWTFLWPTLVIPWFHSLSNNLPHLYLERSTKQSWCQLNFFNGKSHWSFGNRLISRTKPRDEKSRSEDSLPSLDSRGIERDTHAYLSG